MYLSQSLPYKVKPPYKAPAGYAWEWVPDDGGLSGLGKFRLKKIFRRVRRVVKKVAKVAKKVAPVALIAAGAYYSAPWFKALAERVGKSTATSAAIAAAKGKAPVSEQAASTEMPDWAQAAINLAIARKQAKAQAEQAKAQARAGYPPGTTPYGYPPGAYPYGYPAGAPEYMPGYAAETPASEKPSLPAWVLPAAIAGAVALLATRVGG